MTRIGQDDVADQMSVTSGLTGIDVAGQMAVMSGLIGIHVAGQMAAMSGLTEETVDTAVMKWLPKARCCHELHFPPTPR